MKKLRNYSNAGGKKKRKRRSLSISVQFCGLQDPKTFFGRRKWVTDTVNGSDHELWPHKSAEKSEKWDNTIYVFFTYF